ncbi:MAG: hypothetical protein ACR2KB_12015 [Chitinophagaceae bacterium]
MIQDKNSFDRDYEKPNDRSTFMTDLEKLVKELEEKGYTDEYKIEKGQLLSFANNKKYKPKEVKAVNFYRFEGISNPDDMSILYVIETCDGRKGTLIDAYGTYADDSISEFIKTVEINKKTQ